MEEILAVLQDGAVQSVAMIEQGELLGRFDEAVAILEVVPPDGHSEVRAAKIKRLARSGDTQVRMLGPSTW